MAAENNDHVGLSKFMNKSIFILKSVRNPGYAFKFCKKDIQNGKTRYRCCRCMELRHNRVILVENGVVVGRLDPEANHHPDCFPLPESSLTTLQLDREMRNDVRTTGKRTRDAYEQAHSSIAVKFPNSDDQTEIRTKFPRYDDVARQLYRHRDITHIAIPNPMDIPDELRLTWRGLHAPIGDRYYREQFLLYHGQQGRLLIFACRTELQVLHESKYASGDGTFEFAPNTAFQLYTIFGWKRSPNFDDSEGLPLIWALLPDKSQDTYTEMFTAIRDALVREFGSIGSLEYIITDFEAAAIKSISIVFPDVRRRGCTFHFRQAILRKVGNVGLKQSYIDQNPPDVKAWIRKLMGLTLLPLPQFPDAWNIIRNPPIVQNHILQQQLLDVAIYFENTWVNGNFPPELWNHFHHPSNEPRTTNSNEGYHNSLNHIFGRSHPSLRTFMNWLQKYEYEIQSKILKLDDGQPPKKRDPVYVELNERITVAKIRFVQNLAYGIFQNNILWYRNVFFPQEIHNYLTSVSHLVAGEAEFL